MRRVRIGIDVGGTFTDAVAIDDATHELIAVEKIPTTHDAAEGVAASIIEIIESIMRKNDIAPDDVVFIAHGTTQATNALLEGDVAAAGIVGMGHGLFAGRAHADTTIGDIELAPHKFLRTYTEFIDTGGTADIRESIRRAIDALRRRGAAVIIASEPFGVDDETHEAMVMDAARAMGVPATCGHDVSHLYGLAVRTRTAVVNGSLIPKMMETADMTSSCVKRSGISSPLMIMRCDGGVMTTDEVRRRPMLTMLSGLAAGVAGALMYERLSNGIFMESGGTSTDISCVRDGRVMVRYAELGGRKLYLRSLDVRTVGIAGGSMIRVEHGKITGVGPRSAHIAGLSYETFSQPLDVSASLKLVAPCADDEAVYAAVEDASGRRVALTLAGAANVLGTVPDGDYAAGDARAARVAWQALGDAVSMTAEAAAQAAMDMAVAKLRAVVDALARDYELAPEMVTLAGGGGSAGVVTPYMGESMGVPWRIVKHAPVISTIGVAMAMVRESVERTVANPTGDDVKRIRREAEARAMASGAAEGTIETTVEVDTKANILRAVAMGATELRRVNGVRRELSDEELMRIAKASMNVSRDGVKRVDKIWSNGMYTIFDGVVEKRHFTIFKERRHMIRVIDKDGVIRLQRDGLGVTFGAIGEAEELLDVLLTETTIYGTVGGTLPSVFAYFAERQVDLSGLSTREQMNEVLAMETDTRDASLPIAMIAVK
ncbi:MAG: hydantoinase/oxoprolinase family protein [Selenomonadaceae bacterium]